MSLDVSTVLPDIYSGINSEIIIFTSLFKDKSNNF